MLCVPLYDIQHPFYIEKNVKQANNAVFSPVLGLTLMVLVWPAACLASRFLAELFEVRVKPGMRDFSCVRFATPWSWLSVCFGFFLKSVLKWWRPCFLRYRKSTLVLAEFLPLIHLEDERRGNCEICACSGNSDCRYQCWHCSSEQDPKTNLIFLWNCVTTFDEPYSQWAAIH